MKFLYGKGIVAASVGVCVLAAGSFAFAEESAESSATIRVIPSLSVTEIEAINFGTVIRPSEDSAIFVLDMANGVTISGDENGAMYLDGAQSGIYEVTGQPGEDITITATIGQQQDGGADVTLNSLNVAGTNTNTETFTVDGTFNTDFGTAQIPVGGQATVTSTAEGVYTWDVNVVVSYD